MWQAPRSCPVITGDGGCRTAPRQRTHNLISELGESSRSVFPFKWAWIMAISEAASSGLAPAEAEADGEHRCDHRGSRETPLRTTLRLQSSFPGPSAAPFPRQSSKKYSVPSLDLQGKLKVRTHWFYFRQTSKSDSFFVFIQTRTRLLFYAFNPPPLFLLFLPGNHCYYWLKWKKKVK